MLWRSATDAGRELALLELDRRIRDTLQQHFAPEPPHDKPIDAHDDRLTIFELQRVRQELVEDARDLET